MMANGPDQAPKKAEDFLFLPALDAAKLVPHEVPVSAARKINFLLAHASDLSLEQAQKLVAEIQPHCQPDFPGMTRFDGWRWTADDQELGGEIDYRLKIVRSFHDLDILIYAALESTGLAAVHQRHLNAGLLETARTRWERLPFYPGVHMRCAPGSRSLIARDVFSTYVLEFSFSFHGQSPDERSFYNPATITWGPTEEQPQLSRSHRRRSDCTVTSLKGIPKTIRCLDKAPDDNTGWSCRVSLDKDILVVENMGPGSCYLRFDLRQQEETTTP